MNIAFMGTPEFAVPSLLRLHEAGMTPVVVVTAPDKQRGRGKRVSSMPVKNAALSLGIPILQPDSLQDEFFHNTLWAFQPDLIVVVAFRILPASIISLPHLGSINVHASLLPKYRGAAPINWALINGEEETGVTTFFLQESVDTGNIILQERIPLTENTTAGELHDILADAGADLLLRTVLLVQEGTASTTQQDEALASAAPKIHRDTCRLDWNMNARRVHNHIRGLSPTPCAWTMHGEKQMKMLRSAVVDEHASGVPGTVLRSDDELHVQCAEGILSILEAQLQDRKSMSIDALLRGYRIEQGEMFT